MDFEALQAPFSPQEVEWRIGRSGIKQNGDIWAICLAYLTNRAIQQRLDDTCGPDGWQNRFEAGPMGGVVCGISLRNDDGEWITKWDGADARDFEPVKSALSDSMKRAACQWGIGRYLYDLEEGWADTSDSRVNGAKRAKVKGPGGDKWFWWLPPKLPAWALPGKTSSKGSPAPQEAQPVAEEESSPNQLLNERLMEIGCEGPDDADAVVTWLWEGVNSSVEKVRDDGPLANGTLSLIQDRVDNGTPLGQILELTHAI